MESVGGAGSCGDQCRGYNEPAGSPCKGAGGGVQFLIRRGFDRGYVLHAEDTARLRGRIDFNLSMKRQLFLRGRMRCEFDEMSYDVLHNRILKTTIANLLYTDGVDDKQKERLGEYVRYLNPVTSIRISPREFRRVQLHNGNHYYRFLLNICELIYESLLPTEETGHSYFRDFIRDENRMPHVFEQFVRNFYMIEQSTYKVSRSRIDWVTADKEEESYLPKMETDVTLECPDRKIILDCKYYREAFQSHYDSRKFRSENLYQLFAYLKNKEVDPGWEDCEGILLYPVVSEPFRHEFELHGHPVRVVSINLNQDWDGIKEELLELVR